MPGLILGHLTMFYDLRLVELDKTEQALRTKSTQEYVEALLTFFCSQTRIRGICSWVKKASYL